MTPFWQDDHLTLYGGDCREVLRELPDESVHCVVTSPPYWGLRDYGTAAWDGGDPECDHRIGRVMGNANKGAVRDVLDGDRTVCSCGARRIDSQLGLEATPEEFVANMVGVFREVRRVLRRDGTLWLNLGDSYVSGPSGGASQWNKDKRGEGYDNFRGIKVDGLKPKDLVGIPWRVAFALQADGWYLRSDIIWAKPNPMPESVTDRPTKAHEYLFLLTRSPRYYFDGEAVRMPVSPNWSPSNAPTMPELGADVLANGHKQTRRTYEEAKGANIRTVWNIATEPYPGAHFATFPRKLVEPCVKAGTSERGVCPECGAPWVRVVRVSPLQATGMGSQHKYAWHPRVGENGTLGANSAPNERETTGWRPSCTHEAEPVPAVVLDPFAGSGTTLLVAQALGRRGVGIDLSPDYLKQALERNRQTPLGLVG